ncbi:transposase [Bacillus cereus]
MKKQYDEMFKRQCVELVIKEGRSISSIQREFDLGNGTLNVWIKKYSTQISSYESNELEELRSLRREIQALKKENEFLKKGGNLLCEQPKLTRFRFIRQYNQIFGVRWLCHRLQVSVSGFYDYIHRKPTENQKKRKKDSGLYCHAI